MKKRVFILVGAIALISIFANLIIAISQSTTASVTVNSFLSVTLSNAPVTFPNMDPGTTQNASGSNGYPLTLTVDSVSNVNANVSTKANSTTFVSGANNFPVSNMKWDEQNTGPWTNYTTSNAEVCASVAPNSACNIYHRLTTPSGQAAGNYNVGVTITAIAV